MHLKTLVVADHESEYIWDYFDPKVFEGVDVIVSCGDLRGEYLSFLVTMISAPLVYVRGNHDDRYAHKPPEGCIDLEQKPVTIRGVRFVGFGGCKSASPAENHYSEREMARRIRMRTGTLVHGGMDVLVTHAPAEGLGDGEDSFHEGFACFRTLLDRFQPRYHLHGHQHLNYSKGAQRTMRFGVTTIVNGYNYHLLDMAFPEEPR